MLTLIALLAACTGTPEPVAVPAPAPTPARPLQFEALEAEGVKLVLTDADARSTAGATDQTSNVAGDPLSDAARDGLLARLDPLEEQDGDRVSFAKRAGSPPPPLTGPTIDVPFPPPPGPEAPEVPAGPVKVLRFSPQGPVPLAPHLSVSFDRPMVALSSHEVVAETRPLTLDPEPPGEWRWVGTKTLQFVPTARFPMATKYQVTTKDSARAADGSALEKPLSFVFETPAPRLLSSWPNYTSTPLDVPIAMVFDQKVDPAAILEHVSVTGGAKVTLKLATDEDIKRSAIQADKDTPTHTVFLIPTEPLQKSTSYTVVIGKGTPSAEGPVTTPADQTLSFRTYDPLQLERHDCGWNGCTPQDTFWFSFNNELAADVDPATILVDPPVPTHTIQVQGAGISITGMKKADTKYSVTLPAGLKDKFGQTLGKAIVKTFNVGQSQPSLSSMGQNVVVLDPDAPPALPVYAVGVSSVRLQVWSEDPSQWRSVPEWYRAVAWNELHAQADRPPGKLVVDQQVKVANDRTDTTETLIDLAPYLKGDNGHLLVRASVPMPWGGRAEVLQWVQRTHLGMSAFTDPSGILVWVNDLSTGKPQEGVEVELLPDGIKAKTDAQGLAKLPANHSGGDLQVLVARKADDTAFLTPNMSFWDNGRGFDRYPQGDQYRWFIADDRQMYRPDERVSIKGWLRRHDGNLGGGLNALPTSTGIVKWVARDSLYNEFAKGEAALSRHGGFSLDIQIPKTPNLGYAHVELSVDGLPAWSSHGFQIQEFRRPEFEVSAEVAPGNHLLGEHVVATVGASYFAGGGLTAAPVQWQATASPGSYSPPGRSEWSFGDNQGFWSRWWQPWTPPSTASFTAKTGPDGKHALDVHVAAMNPARPTTIQLDATVTDVNRQAWNASASFLVHPASVYVGLKAKTPYVEKGQPVEIDVGVFDIDGKPVLGKALEVRLQRSEGRYKNGTYRSEVVEDLPCPIEVSLEPSLCRFEPKEGGSWSAVATITDDQGRPNKTTLPVWISGGQTGAERKIGQQEVTLIPDKKEYADGGTAKVLLQAPFSPAEALVTWRRHGIVHHERLTLDSSSKTLEVPIRDVDTTGLFLQVDLVGQAPASDTDPTLIPAFAQGATYLSIPPTQRTLQVAVTPKVGALAPGATTEITVVVRDHAGKPVSDAEVAVFAVDESVLALSGYSIPDPITSFYQAEPADVTDGHLRSYLILGERPAPPPDAAPPGKGDNSYKDGEARGSGGAPSPAPSPIVTAAPMMELAAESKGEASRERSAGKAKQSPAEPAQPNGPAIAVRTDFNPLALFAPAEKTDNSGVTKVTIQVPDSLTRYRLVALVAANDRQFGKGESTLTARNPLMVRPSPPRFLNFGDRAEIPVVFQNQTDGPLTVEVALRATNLRLLDAMPAAGAAIPPSTTRTTVAGRKVTIPANDRVELRFPAAAEMAGTARLQMAASTADFADAAEVSLPVWSPATSEAFATYGEIDEGAVAQTVVTPGEVWPQFGGLEITTSSTAVQALTDAVLYIDAYPFDCTEQMSSRVLAIAALDDVLAAFDAEGLPSPEKLKASVERDLKTLSERQNDDGGFPWWRRGDESWPYLSVYNHLAVAIAKQEGFQVTDRMWNLGGSYLKDIESHIPSWYGPEYRDEIIAYSLAVRRIRGDNDGARAKEIYRRHSLDDWSLESLGFLLPVLHAGGAKAEVAAILKHLNNRAVETAGAANFTTAMADEGRQVLLRSDRRVDGVLLDALIQVEPKNDLVPKVVRGLMAHRVKGHWGSTQENAWVLLSLNRYFKVYEAVTPDFVARAWLGEGYAGETAFKGRTTESQRISVPMGTLTDGPAKNTLVLAKEGGGRLYYRMGMNYAPKSFDLAAMDRGFAVERSYESVDKPEDVVKQADGSWTIRAGALVRVRLRMVAPSRRYHVALVDPLPAGIEVLNPDLAVTAPIPADTQPSESEKRGGGWWWWSRAWYEHENLRDERVEAFTTLLWDGVHEYSYVARATTPGEFVVPPAKAEEMYAPETFGRSASDKVTVR